MSDELPLNTSNAKEVLFIEDDDSESFTLTGKAQLKIILLPEEYIETASTPERFRFHVSTNLSIHLQHEDDSSLKGFGVDEIVEADGYSYANGPYGYFAPTNPFYDVYKTGTPGVYETNENSVSIKLLFSKLGLSGVSQDGQIGKAILVHEWPDGRRNIREFSQLIRHDFPSIEP